MFSLLLLNKIIASVYVIGSSFIIYNAYPKNKVKQQLKKVFHVADIFINKKGKSLSGQPYTRRIYPKIQLRHFDDKKIVLIFILPLGLDPKHVTSKLWAFKQMFGDNLVLEGTNKYFKLQVFPTPLKKFTYSLLAIQDKIKNYQLPIYCGKDHEGHIIYDLVKYPHLLIAGETGSGKSTQLHSIIVTLITFNYDICNLYLFDLKLTELTLYRELVNVVEYEEEQILKHLLLINQELNNRMKLLFDNQVTNITKLEKSIRPNFIVIVIDEVAEIKHNKKVMAILERISAIGRSLGVFLVLAMQRPDKDVLDGKLKHNLTVRMAFKHSDEINSRITIDDGAAAHITSEQEGRFILKLNELKLLQAPYLDIEVIKKIIEQYKKHLISTGYAKTSISIEEKLNDDIAEFGGFNFEE